MSWLAVFAALSFAVPTASLYAQDSLTRRREDAPFLRVFLECGACDPDYLRTALTFVNLVRDRQLAEVHVLVTTLGSGGGGTQYSVELAGLGARAAARDTVLVNTQADATEFERRADVVRAIKIALLPFLKDNPVLARIDVAYQPADSSRAGDKRGERDRWNGWVYRLAGGTSIAADDNYDSREANGSVAANHVTERLKINVSAKGNFNRTRYQLDSGATVTSVQRAWRANVLFVQSLSPRLSLGGTADAASSLFENTRLALRVMPAIEYDVFPYREATQRQVIVRYAIGVRSLQYQEATIYDVTSETRLQHELTLLSDVRQRWGALFANAVISQYPADPSKRRMTLDAGIDVRLFAGFNLTLWSGYSYVRDQLNIRGGGLSNEDRLLRQRELQSGFSFTTGAGFSYTFGSVFNNAVNPRLRQ